MQDELASVLVQPHDELPHGHVTAQNNESQITTMAPKMALCIVGDSPGYEDAPLCLHAVVGGPTCHKLRSTGVSMEKEHGGEMGGGARRGARPPHGTATPRSRRGPPAPTRKVSKPPSSLILVVRGFHSVFYTQSTVLVCATPPSGGWLGH